MKNLRAIVVLVLIAAAVLYAQTNPKTGRNYTGIVDNITHGDSTYWVDPGFFFLRDDFVSGTSETTAGLIGELRWQGVGSLSVLLNSVTGQTSPGSLHPGGKNWITSTTTPGTPLGIALPNLGANGQLYGTGWPILDYPNWELVWTFSVRRGSVDTNATATNFPLARKSLYIGLQNFYSHLTTVGRPSTFIGVRFDTSTTSANNGASIGDSTFWLEAVQNGDNGVRNNSQGGITCTITNFALTTNVMTVTCANNFAVGAPLTFSSVGTNTFLNGVTVDVISSSSTQFTANFIHANVASAAETGTVTASGGASNTSITPTENVNYRLSVKSMTAGQVILTLSGGGSTSTATFTMLQSTTTNLAVQSISGANGFGKLGIATPTQPWSPGTQLTVTNITAGGATGLNGTYTVDSFDGSSIFYPNSTVFGSAAANYTAAAYPTWAPLASFCNDDTAAPVSAGIIIDFFGFVWNPNGTVDATQSRYFAGT